MTRVLTVLAYLAFFSTATMMDSGAAELAKPELSLIVAKPVSEKFIRTIDSPPGTLMIGGWYGTKLSSVRVVSGSLKAGKKLYVELIAADSGVVTRYKEIFVVVERVEDGTLRGRWWGSPTNLACVPIDVVKGTSLAERFGDSSGSHNEVCAPLDAER